MPGCDPSGRAAETLCLIRTTKKRGSEMGLETKKDVRNLARRMWIVLGVFFGIMVIIVACNIVMLLRVNKTVDEHGNVEYKTLQRPDNLAAGTFGTLGLEDENYHRMASVKDFLVHAKSHMIKSMWHYFQDGATSQQTREDNEKAFSRLHILPYLLHGVTKPLLNTTILGSKVQFPIGISPVPLQKWAHPNGDIATGKAVESLGSFMVLSAFSTANLESIMRASPNIVLFQQIDLSSIHNVTLEFIRRVKFSGCKGIVVTVDQPVEGRFYFKERWGWNLPNFTQENFGESTDHLIGLRNSGPTWDDLAWLKQNTGVPVIVKGILSARDAGKAVQYGADGILVSNHGGRVLDTLPATIDVLAQVVQEVGGRAEVYLDGGVRSGTDVVKALALGAKAVFVGRPVIWSLFYNGQSGVEQMLTILRDELYNAMAVCGASKPSEVQRDMVRRAVPVM